MSTEELKACPSCGGFCSMTALVDNGVNCNNCEYELYANKQEAVRLHNSIPRGTCNWARYESKLRGRSPYLENPHGGAMCIDKPTFCPNCGKKIEEVKKLKDAND